MTRKKQRKLAFNVIYFVLLLVSCTSNQNEKDEVLQMKMFSVQVSSLRLDSIITQSEDGYRGMILSNNTDTIHFNFGYDIDNLSEKDPTVIYYPYDEADIRSNLDTSLVNPQKIVYTDKPNFDIDEFRKQNVYFDTISGLHAKITVPRRIEKGGITGVYIDSLKSDDGGRLKFNFYSTNLDSLKQKRMLKMVHSIKFKLK
ncbi:MAG: hypothetical protein GXC78_00020 [Chitinophagaceae bacterium]|nr:hypothetical protein [Chitinophagaceae bacterium]